MSMVVVVCLRDPDASGVTKLCVNLFRDQPLRTSSGHLNGAPYVLVHCKPLLSLCHSISPAAAVFSEITTFLAFARSHNEPPCVNVSS